MGLVFWQVEHVTKRDLGKERSSAESCREGLDIVNQGRAMEMEEVVV